MKEWTQFARALNMHRLTIFFGKKKMKNKENDKSAEESDEALVNGDDSRMDKGMIKTL